MRNRVQNVSLTSNSRGSLSDLQESHVSLSSSIFEVYMGLFAASSLSQSSLTHNVLVKRERGKAKEALCDVVTVVISSL